MRQVVREELQQVMREEPQHFDSFSRRFRNRRNFACLIVVEVDTQRYSTVNTNPQRHYVSYSKGTSRPIGGYESYYCRANQGNGLASLSR